MDNKTQAHIIGESLAKLHFELEGYFVYTNSSGKAEFDLLLSKDSLLYAVEVKTVSSLKQNSKGEDFFECQLKSVRSNTSKNSIHHFDNSILDFLAVVNLVDKKVKVIKANEITAKAALRIYRKEF